MKEYISEERAIYEDMYHGLFSKRLAEWAISNMETKDPSTKAIKKISARSVDDVQMILKEHDIDMPDEFIYTSWYLFNMALADYPRSLKTDEQRALFVEETLCDPDGSPENVLACFEAKMCVMGKPIFWEMFI